MDLVSKSIRILLVLELSLFGFLAAFEAFGCIVCHPARRKAFRNISEDDSIQADDVNTEESVMLSGEADVSHSCVATAENASENNNAANEETDQL